MIIKIIGITARTIGSFYYPPIGRLWEALKRNILSCLFFQPVHNPLNKFSGRLLLIFLRHQLIPFIIIGKITYFYQYSRNCCILKNILIDLQWRAGNGSGHFYNTYPGFFQPAAGRTSPYLNELAGCQV